MAFLGKIIRPLFNLIYHNRIPFDHNNYDLCWHIKHKVKNFFKYGTFDFFYKVELEVITHCNRRCSYCPNCSQPKKEKAMDINLFKKVIQELEKIKYSGILAFHLYNEPLLDERLPDLVKYAKAKLPKAYLLIYSNGDLLDREIYEKLVKNGVSKFFVTQHENMPPKKFLAWFKSAGLKDKARVIFQKMDTDSVLSNRAGLVEVKNKKTFSQCLTPRINLIVDVDGNVLLCHHDFFSKNVFGNVKNESLINIWNKDEYKKVRADIAKGVFTRDICKKCNS